MPFVECNGVRIEYEERGSGEETIVMLHNAILCRAGMEPLAERLQDRYRVVLFDFRCMGGSEKPDVEEVGTETLYEDAVSIIRALGNGPVHLVGMALGGILALRVAARQPQLVRSLILLTTTAGGADSHPQGGKFFETLKTKGYADPEIVDISMKISFASAARENPARAEEMARWASVMRNTDRRSLAVARNLTTRLSVEYEMKHIVAPTLVIATDQDHNHPVEEQELVHKAIPGSRFAIIQDCGHTPIVERPDEVAALVRPFLEDVSCLAAGVAA